MRFFSDIPQDFLLEYADCSQGFMQKLQEQYSPQGWFSYFDIPNSQMLPADVLQLSRDLDYIVSIGVGGSYIGLKTLVDFSGQSDKWIFIGPSLDSEYFQEAIAKIQGKRWGILIISKSGTTLEVHLFVDLLKAYLPDAQWVIGASSCPDMVPKLRKKLGIPVVPLEIDITTGGRYSIIGSLGILCLFLLGISWDDIALCMQEEKKLWADNEIAHPSFSRGVGRYLLQKVYGVKIEVLSTKDEVLRSFLAWEEQLLAESDGKSGRGLYLSRLFYPRDAHSVGQIMAQGPRLVAETFYLLEERETPYPTQGALENLSHFRNVFIHSILEDRHQKDVIVQYYKIARDITDLFRLFFCEMLAISLESYLLGINPYDQPGVESYKQHIKKNMDSLLSWYGDTD